MMFADAKDIETDFVSESDRFEQLAEMSRRVDGLAFPPYHGFGDAVLRLTIGENIESGGQNRSSLHRWLMFFDADIHAGGDLIVSKGRLTEPTRPKEV